MSLVYQSEAESHFCLHATSLSLHGRGVLILGASGSGKSALGLKLLSHGAQLISDDQTRLYKSDGKLMATCPRDDVQGIIEARGVGLLRAPFVQRAEIALVVDLSQVETDRLPPSRKIDLLGVRLPLVLGLQNDHLPEAILLYLAGGRWG